MRDEVHYINKSKAHLAVTSMPAIPAKLIDVTTAHLSFFGIYTPVTTVQGNHARTKSVSTLTTALPKRMKTILLTTMYGPIIATCVFVSRYVPHREQKPSTPREL